MDMKPVAFLATCELAAGPVRGGYCWWCQRLLTGRQRKWCCPEHGWEYLENHHWNYARQAALERDGHKCVRCGSRVSLEVNHIHPVLGKHRQNGCHHHVVGLEVLCHDCHVKVTAKQRAAGMLKTKKRKRRRNRKRA